MFYLIKHTKSHGMESTDVEQQHDSLRTLNSANKEVSSPKGMGIPEADILLAIHHVKKDLPNVKEYRHRYTH